MGFNLDGFNPQPQKVVTTINEDGSRTEKRYFKNGSIVESIFKDVNGDGKEDLYSVTRYHAGESGGLITSSSTFIDEDGDGYNDEVIETTYDENGGVKSETRTKEEDINEVLNRPHYPWEDNNRRMDVHHDGWYII